MLIFVLTGRIHEVIELIRLRIKEQGNLTLGEMMQEEMNGH